MIKLYVMDGVDEIQSFDLPGDTVCVGRSPENQIKMKDGYVSGNHLKIIEKGDRYFVQDVGSTNGSFVNGHPIPKGVEVEVEEGVPITFGMSLICLGKACLDNVMPFVDAIFESENLNEVVERYQKRDRPMTEKNTMELVYTMSIVLRESLTLNEIMEKILDSILNLLQRMDRRLIYLDSFDEPYGFRNEDLSLLTALGSSAAVAIENALLCSGKPSLSVN